MPPFEYAADAYVAPTAKTLALGWLSAALKYPGPLAEELWKAIGEPSELALKVDGKIQAYRFYLGWTGLAAFVVGIVVLARRGGFGALRRNRSVRLLALTAIAAGLLAAVQILPTRDLVSVSDRAAPKAPHEPAAFSFFPLRLVETALPGIFGRQFPTHTRWAPFANLENGLWTASMYLGLPAALLGFAMLRVRRGDPRVVWITWVFLMMFWLAIGKFGGPYWMVDPNHGLIARPIDAPRDSKMYGVSDGLYRLCEETIPLFASFRYPEKCFVFCTLALALLSAWGLEQRYFLAAGFRRFLRGALVVAAVVLAAVYLGQGPFERFLGGLNAPQASWGPLNVHGAWGCVVQSLIHTVVVLAAFAALARVGPRTAPLLIGLAALDLAVGNHWQIVAGDQAEFDAKPKLLAVIEENEEKEAREHPGPREPYRIHRTRVYTPAAYWDSSEVSRTDALNAWERDTLVPKVGLPWRTAYATTTGTMSVYDVEFFFAPWPFSTPERLRQAYPTLPLKLTYFPRVGYNLWGAKYFILPAGQQLDHEERGVYTMVSDANGVGLPKLATSDPSKNDYVLLQNTEAFPLAWVVHEVEVQPPIFGLRREDRTKTVERLLYRSQDGGVQIWSGGKEYPLHQRVLVETFDAPTVMQAAAPGPTSAVDSVRFVRDDPGRVELEATLERPGFVVISNAYYRGWKATVDGKEAPILRANRAMQAVPAPSGSHKVVLTYSCRSTMVGGVFSVVSWLGLGVWWLRRRSPSQNTIAAT